MATTARLNRRHSQMVRDKIQATVLIQLLQSYALGEIEEIANGRMRAIEILLKKSVPDLQSIELTGDEENPLVTRVITGVARDKPVD